MDNSVIIELIGYLGSALVVVSMLMTSVIKLRVINLVGSLIFTVYALIIRSYPTAAMNLFLVGINVYHLIHLLKAKKTYDLIHTSVKDGYLAYLLETSMDDIRSFFPDFSLKEDQADIACLITCDRNPAGLFLGKSLGKGRIEVLLDYSTPVYRDTTVGQYLYSQLAQEGYQSVVFKGNAPKHVGYMEKIGYQKTARDEYVLQLRK